MWSLWQRPHSFVGVATTTTILSGRVILLDLETGRRGAWLAVGGGRAGNGHGRVRTGDPGAPGGHPGGDAPGHGRGARRADRRGDRPRGNPGRGQRRGTARPRGAPARPGGYPRPRQRAGP